MAFMWRRRVKWVLLVSATMLTRTQTPLNEWWKLLFVGWALLGRCVAPVLKSNQSAFYLLLFYYIATWLAFNQHSVPVRRPYSEGLSESE